MTDVDAVVEAKRLLREQLRNHPSEVVRLLNHLAVIPDDHPAVVEIAAALRARSQGDTSDG